MLIHRLTGQKLGKIAAILVFAGLVVADLLVARVAFQSGPAPLQIVPLKQVRLFLPLIQRAEEPVTGDIAPTQEPAASLAPAVQQKKYVIKSGDTLYEIAQSFGVTVDDLATANHLDPKDFIMPGQELMIPAPAAPTQQP